jgi:hypothetical protein
VLICLDDTNFPLIWGTWFKAAAKQAWAATLLAAAERKSSEANMKLHTILGAGTMDMEAHTPVDGSSPAASPPLAPSARGLHGSVGLAEATAKSHTGQVESTPL